MSGWFLFFAQMLFFLLGAWYFLRSGSRRKGGRDSISMEENEREMEKLDAMRQVGLTEPLTEQTRPKSLGEIVGQERGIRALRAALCGPNPQHIIIYGPPGVGKTAAARLVLEEAKGRRNSPFSINAKFVEVDATTLQFDERSIADPLLGSVHDPIYQGAGAFGQMGIPRPQPGAVSEANGGVLFIDEIHRLSHSVEEVLYPAMEDFALDIMIGKGPSARSIRLDLPKFTLIGATTRAGMLTSPLRDRFGISFRLELYKPEELAVIVHRSAQILKIPCGEQGALEIAGRSRGTPRIANRLIKRVRDYAEVKSQGKIDRDTAREALDMLEVDKLGLDHTDRTMLRTMIQKFGGGPVGLDTLAACTGEDAVTIEDVYEPYLLQLGFMMRTPRGRVVTPAAYRHLGMAVPEEADGNEAMQTRMDI